MPSNTTYLDIVKFKNLDGKDILNEVFVSNPAFTGTDRMGNKIPIASKTLSDIFFEAKYRISNDELAAFRTFNSGFGTSQGAYEDRRFETKMAGGFYKVDKALVDTNPQAGAEYLAARCTDMLESVVTTMERQFFYGGQGTNSKSDPLGFQGLQILIDKDMVYDAEGFENNGCQLASAYLINFNDRQGVTWMFGKEGTMSFSDPDTILEDDPNDNEKKFPAIQSYCEFYPGVAFLSKYAASRIVNIDTQTAFKTQKNRTAFTDEMIATAIAMWPNSTPNAIIMNKAAGMMLAASRTVTTIAGAGGGGSDITVQSGFTSFPKDHNGIPIAYSDVLIRTEKKVIV
jgi:hypothetical protein